MQTIAEIHAERATSDDALYSYKLVQFKFFFSFFFFKKKVCLLEQTTHCWLW